MGEPAGASPTEFCEMFDKLTSNVGKVIKGKQEVVRSAVIALIAEGHLLIEDVPGVGKTSLARALANSVGLAWNRIQFTPDLLPSDVTGTTVFKQSDGTFSFRPGPIFANVVLADEINRASPKTQSSLLEVMEEATVTTDGGIRPVPRPFIVVATQNPIDLEGTYALPEAQLDRFLMRLHIGYPSSEAEVEILRAERDKASVLELSAVLDAQSVLAMSGYVKERIEVSSHIERYIVGLCAHTRAMAGVRLGVSPRGGLGLLRAARVFAACEGRGFVTPDDVKAMAGSTLTHRVVIELGAEVRSLTPEEVIAAALSSVPVPRSVKP